MANIFTGAILCVAFIGTGIGCLILGIFEGIYAIIRTIRYGILKCVSAIITSAKLDRFYIRKMNTALQAITTDDVRHAKKIHNLMIR